MCPGVVNAARRRRIANHDTMPLIKSTTVMPPTTPPAIAPLFELLLVGEFDDTDEVVGVGVTVTVPVPVTSGASVIVPDIRKLRGLVGKVTHRQQAARPLNSSYRRAVGDMKSDQLGRKEQGGDLEYSWVKKCPSRHTRTHWDGFREAEG